jgi:hypothetical protein
MEILRHQLKLAIFRISYCDLVLNLQFSSFVIVLFVVEILTR